ncbi:hypothetical protein A5740_00790 [Mycobacterium sp. GA-1841]|uniref:hypothetical protein n=1 Tax=Mycobacterium sp. GA-1841 TaxID=1834154 RepID=UPI00096ED0AF|nr:hypothetical protein [Mycobacterium sp. GA-1841]OMC34332.1 hypothetical protein A5740_00790 [Mycobacterium sp. GA-1841]
MSVSVLPDAPGASSWIVDYGFAGRPRPADVATVSSSLDDVLIEELRGAQVAMGCTVEDLLLATLGRAVARTIGEGVLRVDVVGGVGRHDVRQIGVPCVSRRGLSGPELLAAAYPTNDSSGHPSADISFAFGEGLPAHRARSPLAVHIHPGPETTMCLQWRFDRRGFDRCTIEELAEQFPLALIELTSG